MKVKQKKSRSTKNPIKEQLFAAGVTYNDVARLARVSWRMVKFVVDGQRTSAKVTAAINQLSGLRHG